VVEVPAGPIVSSTFSRTASRLMPSDSKALAATPSPSWISPSRMCSVPMKLWLSRRASSWANTSTRLARSVKRSNNARSLLGKPGAPRVLARPVRQTRACLPRVRCPALRASHPYPFCSGSCVPSVPVASMIGAGRPCLRARAPGLHPSPVRSCSVPSCSVPSCSLQF